MELMYKNDAWHGITILSYSDEYTEAWWVSLSCKDIHLSAMLGTENFRKKLLLSIDYFNKSLLSLVKFPENFVSPSYKKPFDDKLPAADLEKFESNNTNDISSIINAYYKKGVMFIIDEKVVMLTKAETEVLSMIARGMSSLEIGTTRGTSTKTVENQLASIKHKTGMNLRSELSQLYYDQFGVLLK